MVDFAAARARLVAQLRQEIKDERVIEAMARVPRECFVPLEEQGLAYEDGPCLSALTRLFPSRILLLL